MFLYLLTAIAGLTVFVSAFVQGWRDGIAGTLIGGVIGVVGGYLVFSTTKKAMLAVIVKYDLHKSQLSSRRLAIVWALIAMFFLWAVFVNIFFAWATKLLVYSLVG